MDKMLNYKMLKGLYKPSFVRNEVVVRFYRHRKTPYFQKQKIIYKGYYSHINPRDLFDHIFHYQLKSSKN